MSGSSRGLESGNTKGGEIHHIAIDHGPMFQGGVLTTHTGGVHGYGWSPGGGFCKSKFLPRRFWRLLRKNSRGTNMRFEYKQIIRFLKNGVCTKKVRRFTPKVFLPKAMKDDDP